MPLLLLVRRSGCALRKYREATLFSADEVVDQENPLDNHSYCFALSGSRFAPVCAGSDAARHFLGGAATPPVREGRWHSATLFKYVNTHRRERIVTMMSLVRLTAIAVISVLILQSGCDFFCQQAEKEAPAEMQKETVPPCHGAGSEQPVEHKHQARHHETNKDCLHPQASDDNSKVQAKLFKAHLPANLVEAPRLPVQFESHVWISTAAPPGHSVSSFSTTILRI